MEAINVSIVLYKTPEKQLANVIESCLKSIYVSKIFLIDNSPTDKLKNIVQKDEKVIYIFTGKNLGYGKAHNIALKQSISEKIPYHLVLNPDIYFEPYVLEELYNFMEKNKDVGLVMPKVCSPDGSLQYLCKLLPTPLDLIGRRFLNWGPLKRWVERRNEIYELRFTKYNRIMEVPFLSGCFMFIRTKILQEVGLFDERFFLYCDDLDLSRRIHKFSKTVFYPYCTVTHEWGRGSYKKLNLLLYHIRDAIAYFNKWGWFMDKERKEINGRILKMYYSEEGNA